MSRVGNLSINFYVNSGSFQINKGRGPLEDVESMTLSIKTWLAQNHDENRDMIEEAISFLDADNAINTLTPTQRSTSQKEEYEKQQTRPQKQWPAKAH